MPNQRQPVTRRARRIAPAVPLDPVALRRPMVLWLAGGVLALLLVPGLRGYNEWIGWMPFWLVLAPMINLLALHPHRLAALSQRFLVGLRQRRQTVLARHRATSRRRPRKGAPATGGSQHSLQTLLATLISLPARH